MTPNPNIDKLSLWVEARRKSHSLEEIAFTPGSDRRSSLEEMAGVALDLIEGWDNGVDATES